MPGPALDKFRDSVTTDAAGVLSAIRSGRLTGTDLDTHYSTVIKAAFETDYPDSTFETTGFHELNSSGAQLLFTLKAKRIGESDVAGDTILAWKQTAEKQFTYPETNQWVQRGQATCSGHFVAAPDTVFDSPPDATTINIQYTDAGDNKITVWRFVYSLEADPTIDITFLNKLKAPSSPTFIT